VSTSEPAVTVDPTLEDVQYLEDRLYEFNSGVTGITDGESLAVFSRDERGRIVAGICGNTWGGCCEIRQFWVEEARRRQGLGTRLLDAAELEARRRGCKQIILTTFVPARLTADDAWGQSPDEREACREQIKRLRSEGIFTPPSLEGTVIFPGYAGGMHWGSVSHDPVRGLLIANTNRRAFVVTLVPRERFYRTLATGRRPGRGFGAQLGTPYAMYSEPLLSPLGLPCNPPPWGALTAVDLATGEVRWEVPLGTTPELSMMMEAHEWGSINFGGSLTTAGGLVFVAAAGDTTFRAFDVETGKVLWSAELPASAQATPMTYRLHGDGKQYLVIAAGGHGKLGTKLGDALVAFALP